MVNDSPGRSRYSEPLGLAPASTVSTSYSSTSKLSRKFPLHASAPAMTSPQFSLNDPLPSVSMKAGFSVWVVRTSRIDSMLFDPWVSSV